jgi:hypothetical protein
MVREPLVRESRLAPPTRRVRRATVYAAVLGVSLIITIIGLSAIAATRVRNREAALVADAAKARFYAQSYIDLTIFRLRADPTWRAKILSNVWSADEALAEAILAYKLVDENDGLLLGDDTQPVRLHAKATVGKAVRLYSVLLLPTSETPTNLLSNPDIESGSTPWAGTSCTVSQVTSPVHGGAAALRASGRASSSACAYQDVTGKIRSGQTYYTEAWVNPGGFLLPSITATLHLQSSGDGDRYFSLGALSLLSLGWAKPSGTITPSWTGTLIFARWEVTVSNSNDFEIDDACLVRGSTPPAAATVLVPVAGAWRQEVLP